MPTGVTSSITSSKGFAKASDSIKRVIGVDIHGALGGKSCAEVAEERLRKDLGSYGGSGGYQGVTIPGLDQQIRQQASTGSSGVSASGITSSSGPWGAPKPASKPATEQPKEQAKSSNSGLFAGMQTKGGAAGGKRLDDSDSDDDKP